MIIKPLKGSILNKGLLANRSIYARWLMNEGSGQSIRDSSGNNLNTISDFSDVFWTAGKFGTGLLINPSGMGYVQLGYFTLPSDGFSVVAWVKPQTDGSSIRTFISNQEGGGTGWSFYYNSWNTTDHKLILETKGSSWLAMSSATNLIQIGQWQQIVAVINRVGGTGKLYHNGIDVTDVSDVVTDFPISGQATVLGIFRDATFPLTNGIIDNIVVYDKLLTASDVQKLYFSPFADLDEEDM